MSVWAVYIIKWSYRQLKIVKADHFDVNFQLVCMIIKLRELGELWSNRVTQSPTKVGADHSNDVHFSNDVFYPNRSTISSTEASFSYSTSKTVTHLSIHFWADLPVNLKPFAIALFHLIQAFASRFFSRFDARTRFFRFFFTSAVILPLACRTIITFPFWATDSSSLFLLAFALLWLWVASMSRSAKASELALTNDFFIYRPNFSRSFFDIS